MRCIKGFFRDLNSKYTYCGLILILREINRFKCFSDNLLSPLVFHTVQAVEGSNSPPVPDPSQRPCGFQPHAGIVIPECFDERIDCCRIFQPSEYFCSLPAVSLIIIRKQPDEMCQSLFLPDFRSPAFLHGVRIIALLFCHRNTPVVYRLQICRVFVMIPDTMSLNDDKIGSPTPDLRIAVRKPAFFLEYVAVTLTRGERSRIKKVRA